MNVLVSRTPSYDGEGRVIGYVEVWREGHEGDTVPPTYTTKYREVATIYVPADKVLFTKQHRMTWPGGGEAWRRK